MEKEKKVISEEVSSWGLPEEPVNESAPVVRVDDAVDMGSGLPPETVQEGEGPAAKAGFKEGSEVVHKATKARGIVIGVDWRDVLVKLMADKNGKPYPKDDHDFGEKAPPVSYPFNELELAPPVESIQAGSGKKVDESGGSQAKFSSMITKIRGELEKDKEEMIALIMAAERAAYAEDGESAANHFDKEVAPKYKSSLKDRNVIQLLGVMEQQRKYKQGSKSDKSTEEATPQAEGFRDDQDLPADAKDEIGTFWVVTQPSDVSELADILFDTRLDGIMRQTLGGLKASEIRGIFKTEGPAREMAEKLLSSR